MVIQRSRESRRSRTNSNNIKMTIDIMTFNIFCRYVISTSSYLRITHLINLRKLISGLDPNTYENDPDKIKRVKFLFAGLEARIDYKLNDINLVMNHVMSRLDFDVDFIDFNNYELNADEILWVHQMVSESLQYFFVYDATDKLLDLCTRIKSSDYQHRGILIQEFESVVDQLKNQFRTSKSDDSLTDMTFSLRPEKFEQVVTETHNLIRNPSRRLMTGMQGLNEMIGGGFESGRVYMLLGITGIGKSITILNLLYQLKRYNKHYKTKDPTKTPCIVLLTMENTVVETITRLFDLVVNNSQGMANYTIEEVLRKLREEGELLLNDDSPIDIVIKYKANKSVDTSYLYTLCDDLEDDGYEVMAVIVDYIKRIRSSLDNSDTRIWLGNVINEFKVFAETKQCVVITASQLNRDATQHIDESRKANKNDLVRMLGRAQIGESMLILENLDGAFIIAPEWDNKGQKYLGIQRIKKRYKASDLTYLYYPYQGEIKLLEDFNAMEPVYKTTMKETPSPNLESVSRVNEVKSVDQVLLKSSSSNNIFLSGSMSSIDNTIEEPKLKSIVKRI